VSILGGCGTEVTYNTAKIGSALKTENKRLSDRCDPKLGMDV